MQKTRINRIINIIFIGYLLISILWNSVKAYQDWVQELGGELSKDNFKVLYEKEWKEMNQEEKEAQGLKPLEEMTGDEFDKMMQKNITYTILMLVIFNIIVTFFQNSLWILLFVAIKVASKKVIKEKLNEDDFKKSKEYFRDILQGYSMGELSWIDNFQLEFPKDIIAEILQLENKKVIKIGEEGILVDEAYDKTKLNQSQIHILDGIKNGKVKQTATIGLEEAITEDAIRDGLIEEKNELKKRQIKRIVKSIIAFVIMNIILRFVFLKIDGMYIENTGLVIIMIIGLGLGVVLTSFYPIVAIISYITYSIKYKSNPYFRTEKGKELNKRIEGLKNYLKDYTLLDRQEKEGIVVWEDYLVYSVLFNQNRKIIEKYKRYIED